MAEKSRNADFDKTVKTKKKEKRNGRAFTIFAILVLLLLGTYFCMTKLFVFKNLKIVSEGKEHYTEQQILEGAGINKGVLLHELDIKSAAYKASYNLPYVDISFKKRFPTTLVANVKYRQPKFYINVANSMYVLSEDLVVLEKTADIEMIEANALVFVEFSDINKCIEGEKILLEDEIKEIFESLVFELDSAGMLGRISGINMKNKYDISLMHDTRYSVKIGDRSNLQKKILLMKTVIEDKISVGETGSIDVTDEDIKIVVFKKH